MAQPLWQVRQVRRMGGAAPPRGDFARLLPSDIEWFEGVLGKSGVVTDEDALAPHNSDWMHKYRGSSKLMLKPHSTLEVSEILSYCNMRQLAVVPQGGNTGLVGGSVPMHDEIILSLAAMNQVVSFDETSGALVAEAGCVLQALEDKVAKCGWMVPLDLGAKGSCQIGGNIATNAGGLRLLRYGSLHGSVLGVEVVLADGGKLDLLRTLRKDNTGIDLKQLFVGSEGTLGVVTAVALQCAPAPASVQSVFLAVPSFEAVTQVLLAARRQLAEILSAAEFLDDVCMSCVLEKLPGVSNPLPARSPFYMLLETHGSDAGHDTEKLERFLESAMSAGCVADGAVAASAAQAAAMWRLREGIAEAMGKTGSVYKYDVSLPVSGMYRLVDAVRSRLQAELPAREAGPPVVGGYGHVGDGNLHLNVAVPGGYTPEVEALLEPFVYEHTTDARGSISAEHGIGVMKPHALKYSKDASSIRLMRKIKSLVDPRGILNPYKMLPPNPSAKPRS